MLLLITLAISALFAQQYSYNPAEIDNGKRIYESSCGTCHGALGDAVPGIDLGKGQFRRAVSDEDLVRIIRTGVPGTSMPLFNFSELQAGTIVAYLRNMTTTNIDRNAPALAALPPGDAARGKGIVEGKGQCLTCHWIYNAGKAAGPDLSAIGAPRVGRSASELQRSLVEPNAEVRPENRTIRVVPRNGAPVVGTLMNQDTHSIQLLEPSGLTSFSKSNLREYKLVDSPMPSFRDRLTAQELSDVISYLVSLKGFTP